MELIENFLQTKRHTSDKKCFKCGDNFTKRHLQNCKAEGKTCYKCWKKGYLSTILNRKQIKLAQIENLERTFFKTLTFKLLRNF